MNRLQHNAMQWAAWLILLVHTLPAGVAAGDRPVVVSRAEFHEMAPVEWYPATVISRFQTQVPAEVEGRLVSLAEVGDRVARGEVVARIDDELLRQESTERKADVARIQARLRFLDREVKRLQRLAKQNNAAQSQLEQVSADQAAARSEMQAARAREAYTDRRLERCLVKAPFDGVITERLLEAGEWAESGKPVVVMIDPAQLEVQSWVPLGVLKFVAPGTLLQLDVGGQTATGSVRVRVPVADNRSRLFELRIRPDVAALFVGQSIRVAVPVAKPGRLLTVPRDALVLRRGVVYVYRINDQDVAERVSVSTGIASGDRIAVTGALKAGDRVVIRGGERLREGQSVNVLPLDTPG